jgi:AcrR family transcriptional regulator
MKSKKPRRYRQTARARSVEETRERILRSSREQFFDRYFEAVTLASIAEQAGVTVQTVLRQFGSKQGLLAALIDDIQAQVGGAHGRDEVGQAHPALDSVLARYEAMGDGIVRILSQEDRVEPFAELARRGREDHRRWIETIFEPLLPAPGQPERERRVLQLLLLFDVYGWKLLRRDHGADFETTRAALAELLEILLLRMTRSSP